MIQLPTKFRKSLDIKYCCNDADILNIEGMDDLKFRRRNYRKVVLGMVLVFQYCKSVDSFCSVLVLIDCNLYHLNHMERKGLE